MRRPRTSRRRIAVAAATALLASATAQLSGGVFHAAPGDVDPAFGTAGISVTNAHSATQSDVTVAASVSTADGHLVLAGDTRTDTDGTDRALVVFKLDATGAPDTGFGTGGRVLIDRGPLVVDRAVDVDLLPDGRIVVLANASGIESRNPAQTVVVRLTATGSLDTTFDGDGIAVIDLDPTPFSQFAFAFALRGDGAMRISLGDPGAAIIGLASDGTLDASFGNNGRLGTPDYAQQLAWQSTGVLVALVGQTIVRYSSTGTELSTSPSVNISCGGSCPLTIDASDRVLVAGRATFPDLVVRRFTPTGDLDATFGTSGSATIPATELGYPAAVTVSDTGLIYVAVERVHLIDPDNGVYDYALAVIGLDGTGTPLATFGSDGVAIGASASDSTDASSLMVLADEPIAVGTISGTLGTRGLLTRFDDTGAAMSTFGTGGTQELRIDMVRTLDERILDTATDHLGRMVGAGFADSGDLSRMNTAFTSGRRVLVTRWTAAHVLDPSFGGDGVVDLDNGGFDQQATAVTVDALNRVIVVATGLNEIVVTRLLPDGTLDPTFGAGGNLALGARLQHGHDVIVDANGRILVTGDAPSPVAPTQALRHAVRLDEHGVLDPTFGAGGVVTLPFGLDPAITSSDRVLALATPDGGALFAATGNIRISFFNFSATSLVRLDATGAPAAAFGVGGTSVVRRPNGSLGVLRTDGLGRIILGGAAGVSVMLARFLPTGAPDPSFAGSGFAQAFVGGGSQNFAVHDVAADAFGNYVALATGVDQPDPNRTRAANPGTIVLARFGEAGVDTAFGTDGIFTRAVTADDAPIALVGATTSRLVVYGAFEPVAGHGHDIGAVALEQGVPGGGDPTAPTITTNVPDGLLILPSTPINIDFSCADTGGSGVVTCSGPPLGTPIGSLGMPWGAQTLRFRAIDGAGNVTDVAVPVVVAETVSTVGSGTTMSTLGTATEPTADDPIESRATIRGFAGSVVEVPGPQTLPGYTLAPWKAEFSIFQTLAANPHLITIWLDSTLAVSTGVDATNLLVLREGVPMQACTAVAPACVTAVTTTPTGDLQIDIREIGLPPLATGFQFRPVPYTFGRLGVDTATGTFGTGGGTVTTGNVATPSDPIESTLTSPVAGTITVTEQTTASVPPTGFSLLGNEVVITAPIATPANPLRFVFRLDATLLAAGGVTPETVTIFRNGVAVPACTNPAAVSATPDPCVFQRTLLPDGDAEIGVYTSAASTWAFGKHTPYAFSGFLEWSAYPTLNTAKGGNIEVVFGLGGNQGLAFFAARSPSATPVDCTTLAPTGTATPIAYELEYNRSKARYEVEFDVPKAWRNTCRTVAFTFNDGSTQRLAFRIR